MLTFEKVVLIQELKMCEVALLALNKALEKKLAELRGEKICVVCDKPVDNDDMVHDSCYKKEWKEVRIDEGRG